jgi:anaerobic magnesium-protoporphyrin IX monomethyl ester cyclase
MKVLLINPPITVFRGGTNPRVYMPIGLLYVAAQLEKEGHSVEVFDALLKAEFHEDKSSDERCFGESWDALSEVIRNSRPGLIGIGSMFSSQSGNSKKVAATAKQVYPDVPVVVGGPHASACPKDLISDGNINFVVIGEGEYTLGRIIGYLEGKGDIKDAPGLLTSYRGVQAENFVPERIQDLDKLPLPAYHLYDMERFFYLQTHGYCARPIGYGDREVSLITSRGCPYHCVFCSIHTAMGRKWRAHSAQYVLDHISFLKRTYNVDLIHFEDDNFSLERKRFDAILDGLIDGNMNIKWDPTNGLRADSLDEGVIRKAMRSGCQYIVIAIESGVQRVLDEVIEIARICKKLKIELYAYYVVGFPGETLKEVEETFVFARTMLLKYFLHPQVSIAAPVWGSRLHEICKEGGFFADTVTPKRLGLAYDAQGKGLIKTEAFTPDDLKELISRYNRQFAVIMALNVLRKPSKVFSYLKILIRNPYLIRKAVFNK